MDVGLPSTVRPATASIAARSADHICLDCRCITRDTADAEGTSVTGLAVLTQVGRIGARILNMHCAPG